MNISCDSKEGDKMKKKQLFLTPRDRELLVDLYRLVFVDINYVTEAIYTGSNKQFIYRRTKRLEDDGYLASFRLPMLEEDYKGGYNTVKVFKLDRKGISEVREILGYVDWDNRWTDRTPLTIYHNLELAMVKASFTNQQGKDNEFKLHEWITEQRAFYKYDANPQNVIRPDALLMLDHEKVPKTFTFMIELERSRQQIEVTHAKLRRYNEYCEKKGYEEQTVMKYMDVVPPRVVFISKKESDMNNLIKYSNDVNTKHIKGILFTTYDKLRSDPYGKIFKAKGSKNPDQLYGIADAIE